MQKDKNQQFLKAVHDGRFEEAEALLKEGVDINALLGPKKSLLGEALVEPIPEIIIPTVEFFMTHGLDPNVNNGRHILIGLKELAWNACGPELVVPFKSLLGLIKDFDITLDKDGKTLEQSMEESAADAIGFGLYHSEKVVRVMSAILRAQRKGCAGQWIFGWDQAIGKKISDVFLGAVGDGLNAPEMLVIDCDNESALIIPPGIEVFFWSDIRRLKAIMKSKTVSPVFPEIVGRTITEAKIDSGADNKEAPERLVLSLDDGTSVTVETYFPEMMDIYNSSYRVCVRQVKQSGNGVGGKEVLFLAKKKEFVG